MIDVSYEVNKFRPVDISAIPSDDKYGENVRLAFALYNKALQKINNGYEDLARIDLKKAIQLHQNFYVAIILLGMCTFANGDRIGAVRIFNSVKDPEMREKALNYLDYLAGETDRTINKETFHNEIKEEEIFSVRLHSQGETNYTFEKIEIEDNGDLMPVKSEPVAEEVKTEAIDKSEPEPVKKAEKDPEIIIKQGTNIYTTQQREEKNETIPEKEEVKPVGKPVNITGITSVVAIVIIIVLGIIIFNVKSENADLKESLLQYTDSSGHIIATNTPGTTSTLNKTAQPTITPVDYYAEAESKYKQCIKHYNFKQYYNVVEIYHTLNMDYISEEERVFLKGIYDISLESFTRQNYNACFALSSQGKYSEVLDLLLPIQKYNPDYKNSAAVLFYIAKAYEDMKDNTKAKEYYNLVVDKYPNTEYANWASYRNKVIG